MWVPERAGLSTVRGVMAKVDFRGDRPAVLLAAHTYNGVKYDSRGKRVDAADVTRRANTDVTYDAAAWISGVLRVRLTSGPLSRYWVPQADLSQVQ